MMDLTTELANPELPKDSNKLTTTFWKSISLLFIPWTGRLIILSMIIPLLELPLSLA